MSELKNQNKDNVDCDGYAWPSAVCSNCQRYRWSKNNPLMCAWCGHGRSIEEKVDKVKDVKARKPRSKKALKEAILYYQMKGEVPPWESYDKHD